MQLEHSITLVPVRYGKYCRCSALCRVLIIFLVQDFVELFCMVLYRFIPELYPCSFHGHHIQVVDFSHQTI